MALASQNTKQQAHELIDSMAPGQVSAVVGLLKIMLDPVDRAIANAPFEDEEISEEETRAVAASKAWLKDHDPIPNEEVLAEFGLTAEDFERMGRTPLEPEPHHPGQ
ncbi:MAG: hypothetical protein ABSC47_08900 [Terracidiphilus sp.]|jgi:hypothetical protein